MFDRFKKHLFGNNGNDDRNFSVNDDIERFLSNNNCHYEKFDSEDEPDSQSKRYFFDFQGGHFIATTSQNGKGIDVTYPCFLTVDIDELNLVRAMCNKYNSQSSVFKVIYSSETSDNSVRIHLSFFVNVILEEQFQELLNACFYFQRSFVDEYENAKNNQDAWKTDDIEQKFIDKAREQVLIAEQEMKHEKSGTIFRTGEKDDYLCIEHLIFMTMDDHKPLMKFQELSIIHGGECFSFNDKESAYDFFVYNLLVGGRGKNATFLRDQAVAIVKYTIDDETVTYTITAQKEGEDNSSLYMRVGISSMYRSPGIDNSFVNNSEKNHYACILVAYDKTSPKEKIAEADFMWKEAITKLKNGEKLTDEERLIADVVVPDIAYNIYWGEKLMLSQRYFEALRHLKNAFYDMRTRFLDLNKRERATFSELCYKIGFCLTELKQYEKAYFYLEFLRDNGNIRHNTELVNCLVNGKDMRSFQLIDTLLLSITQQMESDEEEEVNENILSFYNFLRRRKAYALLDFGKIDEAEEAFRAMLEEPANSDYAMQELAYIQNLRQKNDDKTEGEPLDDSAADTETSD